MVIHSKTPKFKVSSGNVLTGNVTGGFAQYTALKEVSLMSEMSMQQLCYKRNLSEILVKADHSTIL